MKTSYVLLALIVLITLMGMTATNVLLKQEYDKLDWSNPLQGFEEKALPAARHWVIDGRQVREIIIEPGSSAKAFIHPQMVNFYTIRQQGDTMFVEARDKRGETVPYRNWQETESIGLLIRIPALGSVRMTNGLLTVRRFTLDSLHVMLANTRLNTENLVVRENYAIDIRQSSSAILGADKYNTLQAVIRDSSSLRLDDTQLTDLQTKASPNASVELTGRALRWLGKP